MGERAQAGVAEWVDEIFGPWTVCFSRYNGYVAGFHIAASPHGSTFPIVSTAVGYADSPFSPDEIERQGNLIAAAPELKDFVAGITDCLGYAEWSTPAHAEEILRELIDRWHPKGRAAIAKAEGR